VRPYDVIVRYGGDELICAMPNLSASEARTRFEKIAALLTAADAKHSFTFGLAEAQPADTLQELLARADADLLQVRRSHRGNGARTVGVHGTIETSAVSRTSGRIPWAPLSSVA